MTSNGSLWDIAPALYFGCWDRAGQGWHDARGNGLSIAYADIDGGYVPLQAKKGAEGVVRLTQLLEVTVLGFRDNSVDSRPGSHATFVLRGELDYDEALAIARRWFSFVFQRLEARGITLTRETIGV